MVHRWSALGGKECQGKMFEAMGDLPTFTGIRADIAEQEPHRKPFVETLDSGTKFVPATPRLEQDRRGDGAVRVQAGGGARSTDARPWTLGPSLDSLQRVFRQQDFGRYFLNSLFMAGVVVVAFALIAFLAATAVTRFRFRMRTTLLIMFLIAQMMPVEALTIPMFFLMRTSGT